MTTFSKELITEMGDNNVHIEKLIHIPTLIVYQGRGSTRDFEEFLEDAHYEDLIEQCPSLEKVLNAICEGNEKLDISEIVEEFCHKSGDLEFLVQIYIATAYGFKFNQDGQYISNSVAVGTYITEWIFAKNMNHAAEIAIKYAEAYWNNECEKAKLKYEAQI